MRKKITKIGWISPRIKIEELLFWEQGGKGNCISLQLGLVDKRRNDAQPIPTVWPSGVPRKVKITIEEVKP